MVARLLWGGCLLLAAALAEDRRAVLNDDTFHEFVRGRTGLVALGSSECGDACRALAPLWADLAADLPDVLFPSVDCAAADTAAVCGILLGVPAAAVAAAPLPAARLVRDNAVYAFGGPLDAEALRRFLDGGYRAVTGTPLRRSAPAEGAAEAEGSGVVAVDDGTIGALEAAAAAEGAAAILEFYAPWCGYCQRFAPTFAQLARTLAADQPTFTAAKYDASVHDVAAKRYGIRAFPTLVVLKGGRMYDYQGPKEVGAMVAFMEAPEGEGRPLPGPWTLWSEAADFLEAAAQDVHLVVTRKWNAAVLLFLSGLLTGCALVVLLSRCLPSPRPHPGPPAVPPPASKKDQ